MIANLRFDRAGTPRFEPATNVRLATVCNVANTVTEHLARLLDCPVSIDLFEPVVVPLGAQPALFANATLFLARARRSDLLMVIRDRDARRLVACAFGLETDALSGRDLSAIEERVLAKIASEVSHLCAALTGEIRTVERAHGAVDAYDCATYFELRLAPPVDVVIGLGLAKDPVAASDVRIGPSALEPVGIQLRAQLGRTRVAARTVMALRVGTVVTFDAALDEPAALLAGNTVVAQGECGVRNGKIAFHISSGVKGTSA